MYLKERGGGDQNLLQKGLRPYPLVDFSFNALGSNREGRWRTDVHDKFSVL